MIANPTTRGDPPPCVRRATAARALLALAAAVLVPGVGTPNAAPGLPEAAADTSGLMLLQWAYDAWTVPWVHVRGPAPMLAPASHATLMVLACETANLERDRLARHLSAEECEHRMAAIRADQDTALIFRLDLRSLTVAEHRLRFARRDARTGELVVSSATRWLRLRLASGGHEWVATWAFRTDEGR